MKKLKIPFSLFIVIVLIKQPLKSLVDKNDVEKSRTNQTTL
jgi:hypothetical protein